jgi:hypothetical protein
MDDPLFVERLQSLEDPAKEPQGANGIDSLLPLPQHPLRERDSVDSAFDEIYREERKNAPLSLDDYPELSAAVKGEDELRGRLSSHHACEGQSLSLEEHVGVEVLLRRFALDCGSQHLQRETRGRVWREAWIPGPAFEASLEHDPHATCAEPALQANPRVGTRVVKDCGAPSREVMQFGVVGNEHARRRVPERRVRVNRVGDTSRDALQGAL